MSQRRIRLGVDAGHGGPDHSDSCVIGGKCPSCGTKAGESIGLVESAYTRNMADMLLDALPADMVEVYPLNYENESPTIWGRGSRARDSKLDLVLSLHVNESESKNANGAHMLYLTDVETEHICEQVALSIAKRWPQRLSRTLRPRQRDGIYIAGMIEPAKANLWPRANNLLRAYEPVPTVLVEMFYASNADDARAAIEPWCQMMMLGALVAGVAQASHMLSGQLSA